MEVGHDEQSPAARMITLVLTPVVIFVGVVGNCITLAVFLKPRNKTSSTAIYFVWLAIADMLVILFDVPRWWIIYYFGYDFRHYSSFVCKSHQLAVSLTSTLSSYVLLTLTIERLISVIRPHQLKTICTMKTANIVCLSIIAANIPLAGMVLYGFGHVHVTSTEVGESGLGTNTTGAALTSHVLDSFISNSSSSGLGTTLITAIMSMATTLAPEPDKVVCSWYRDEQSAVAMTMDRIIRFFVGFFIVQAVMLIADVVIIYRLMSTGKQSGHIRQITVTLVSVNVVYMLCRTPVYVFMSFINKPELNYSPEALEISWSIINVLFFTNHAANFFLYVLIGDRFRKQVFEMVCWWKAGRNSNKVSADTNQTKKTTTSQTAAKTASS